MLLKQSSPRLNKVLVLILALAYWLLFGVEHANAITKSKQRVYPPPKLTLETVEFKNKEQTQSIGDTVQSLSGNASEGKKDSADASEAKSLIELSTTHQLIANPSVAKTLISHQDKAKQIALDSAKAGNKSGLSVLKPSKRAVHKNSTNRKLTGLPGNADDVAQSTTKQNNKDSKNQVNSNQNSASSTKNTKSTKNERDIVDSPLPKTHALGHTERQTKTDVQQNQQADSTDDANKGLIDAQIDDVLSSTEFLALEQSEEFAPPLSAKEQALMDASMSSDPEFLLNQLDASDLMDYVADDDLWKEQLTIEDEP